MKGEVLFQHISKLRNGTKTFVEPKPVSVYSQIPRFRVPFWQSYILVYSSYFCPRLLASVPAGIEV